MYSPGNSVVVNSFMRWPVVTTIVACCAAIAAVVPEPKPVETPPAVVAPAPVVAAPVVVEPPKAEPKVVKCPRGIKPHLVNGELRCPRG